MYLPQFTAELAVYPTRNVYREFGQNTAFAQAPAADADQMVKPPAAPVCSVHGCPVRVFPCDPPECTRGETCCLTSVQYSGGYKNEYYGCANLETSREHCGVCDRACAIGEVCCNGSCIDTASTGYNCEECGCANGMTCQSGTCRCPVGQTSCNGFCVDLSSNSENCGSCGNSCPDLGNTICVNGKCQCSVYGDVICSGSCTNPYGDSKNCGGCGNVCRPGTCCSGGTCVEVDLLTDPKNCGACDSICYFSNCCSNGKCADILTDPSNCGTCGSVCSSGCCSGGECRDLSNDPNNCGYCGNVCASGCCSGGLCADLGNDAANCGTCGNVCANGCCVGAKCADLSSDPNNCGFCGNTCPTGSCCRNGTCTTVPSLSSVSPNPSGNCGTSASTNYFIAGANCENITNLEIYLSASQNLFSSNGFSVQLNAVPPSNNQVNWMQYVFEINGKSVEADVEYWTLQGGSECIIFSNQNVSGCCSNANCCNCSWWDNLWGISCCDTSIASLPNANTIPSGYKLDLTLATNPTGNVTQANFVMVDNNGNIAANHTVAIPQNVQVPVQSFQVVVVGVNGCATANFSNGGGTLVYGADQQLCVQGASIRCSGNNAFGGGTGEASNATYGLMSSCCGTSLAQSVTT